MREVSYLSKIDKTPERKTIIVPATDADKDKRTAITCAALAILRQHPDKPLVLKTTVKILADEKAWRESIIAAYFSRIAEFLSMAHEKYTARFTGTIEARKQMMHENFKWEYCRLHPDHYITIKVVRNGEIIEAQHFFTLSDHKRSDDRPMRPLTDKELALYIAWAFGEMDDMLGMTA